MDWGVEVFRMLGFSAERLACFRGLGFKVGFRPLSIHATRGGGQFRPVLDCPSEDVRSGNVEKRDIQGDCLSLRKIGTKNEMIGKSENSLPFLLKSVELRNSEIIRGYTSCRSKYFTLTGF